MKTVLVVMALCLSVVGQAVYSGPVNYTGPEVYSSGSTIKSPACTAASLSSADVQYCFSTALHCGDIISLPSGTGTWSTQVTLSPPTGCAANEGITIQGQTSCSGSPTSSCTDRTNITLNTVTFGGAFAVSGLANTAFLRITGVTFTLGLSGTLATIDGTRYSVAFRMDHDHFIVANGLGASATGFRISDVYGLIDHVLADDPTTQTNHFFDVFGTNFSADSGYDSWNQPSTLGTSNSVFVEDSTFNCEPNEECLDVYTGGRLVFRHNALNNGFISNHGTDSGNARAGQIMEIYSNAFTNNSATNYREITFRGGTGVVWGNTFTRTGSGVFQGMIAQVQRTNNGGACGSTSQWQTCNGTAWYPSGNTLGNSGSGSINNSSPVTNTSLGFCTHNLDQWELYNSTAGNAACNALHAGDTATASFDQGIGGSGYPCRDQPGRGHNQVAQPIYTWSNAGETIASDSCSAPYLTSGVDFVNNGTTPLPGYTAYTYPHPLQGTTAACGPPSYSCFSTSTSAVAQANPIPSWGANTCDSTSPYTLQNCGNLTGAGTVQTPFDFSQPIVRLTDSATVNAGITWGTADNGDLNLFASDDSWVIIRSSGGTRYLMAFNPATMAGQLSGITYNNTSVIADHTSNSTVYLHDDGTGVASTQIFQDTLPVPLGSCAPSCTQPAGANHVMLYDFLNSNCLTNSYAGDPSWAATSWTGVFTDTLDDTGFTIAFADTVGSGQKGSYVAHWKKSYGPSGGCDLYNTVTGAILVHDGTHLTSSNTDLFYNHEAYSSLSGTYAIVSTSGPSFMINGTYVAGVYFWQIGTGTVVHCGVNGGPYCDGHIANGYTKGIAGGHLSVHTYTDPNGTNPAPLLIPSSTTVCADNHQSWNHDNSTDAWPVMDKFQKVGSFNNLLGGATPPCAYYDEIVFAQTDGSSVSRAAHTFSSGWHWNFQVDNAIAVESSSGKFAMWPSDGWGQFGNTSGAGACHIGGPDWAASDSTHYTATSGAFGNYIHPLSGNSNHYIYQVQSCSGGCTSGTTEPTWPSSGTVVDNTITWVNTGTVYDCRADILVVKLTR